MEKYFIGLDMGTNSVGWAVTNPQYELIRKKGKDMWGIREFDRANGAVDRRTHRINRRRLQRKKAKIAILKSYFADAIVKEDPSFFIRLDNSFYHMEDKAEEVETKYVLFADKDYTDKDYYKEYPTIFHLQNAFLKNQVPMDERYARKLYLALSSYFARRGHFLNKNLSGDSDGTKDVVVAIKEMSINLSDKCNISLGNIEEFEEDIRTVFAERSLSRTKKAEKLQEILGIQQKSNLSGSLVLKAIVGLKVDLVKLFNLDIEQKAELDFTSVSYEEKRADIDAIVGEEYADILDSMKEAYDAGTLTAIMSGVDYLVESRIKTYEKHQSDLKRLKTCIKKYCGETEYDFLFRTEEDGTYSAYIGSVNSKRKVRRGEQLNKSKYGDRWEKLKKRIKNDLELHAADEEVSKILNDIELDNFLPKQLTYANGVIPNQLYEREMRQILNNACMHLEFLNEKDVSGKSVSERILQLFTFVIPYYIGPTSKNYRGNGWVIRREGMEKEKILPWNIQDVIDYGKTSEAFIMKMVRECSYFANEHVLPKESMEYQAYMVLDAINTIRIDGEKLSVKIKQDLYHNLLEQKDKISKKDICEFLYTRGVLKDESQLTGIDREIKWKLSTYRKFYGIFGDDIKLDSYKAMIEQIVFWGTIYGDEKGILKDKIIATYGERITKEQLKRILGFKFRDWGNLSKQFLEMPGCDVNTGEVISLIRAMWEDNRNLQELINSEAYNFKQVLAENHKEIRKVLSEYTYEDLQNTYFSAPVKRMIWQTIQIIQEIEVIMGCAPDKIFVEMTRTDDEKGDAGRKDSREKELSDLYKAIREDRDWIDEIKNAGESGRLRSKKLYLYYKQKGMDMYSGEPIDLAELFDDNKYDIDHIYPRHYVKDDSIHNNLVLVNKQTNNRKSDVYPIDAEIRNNPNVKKMWKSLHELHFISDEKYKRLTHNVPFSEEQKAEFIARQLVETSQATKGVNDLLKEIMPKETTIVYAKAKNVSDFRKEFGFVKCRKINDFHHAHDAYLNIVVGNSYYTKFTLNPMNFVRNEKLKYHLGNLFHYTIERNGYTAWEAPTWDKINKNQIVEEGKTLTIVRKMLSRNTPLMTRLCTTQHGEITDATIYSHTKKSAGAFFPLKNNNILRNVERYGGYNSIKIAYYFLVEHEIPGKGKQKGQSIKTRTIECLPVYMRSQVENNPERLQEYCLELGLKNPSIRIPKLKPKSLLKVNGFPVYITGRSEERFLVRNACNLILESKWNTYIHLIEKFEKQNVISKDITKDMNHGLYDELCKKHCEGLFKTRPTAISDSLLKGKEKFDTLNIERQIYVLCQILNATLICDSKTSDLHDIGGSSGAGASKISKNVFTYESFSLVNQSITGIYEKEVDLLKV